MTIETRELSAELWPDLERLFGPRGACGGCWCMSWRTPRGERWDDIKGDEAKRRMQALDETGKAHGVIAYDAGLPIGWCSFGPRRDYAKLDRAPSFSCDDADQVWSIPCFFVAKGHHGKGVAKAMLASAVEAIARLGGTIAEGYPVKPSKDGKSLPAAFVWTGVRPIFDALGFEVAGNEDGGKQRVRRRLPPT